MAALFSSPRKQKKEERATFGVEGENGNGGQGGVNNGGERARLMTKEATAFGLWPAKRLKRDAACWVRRHNIQAPPFYGERLRARFFTPEGCCCCCCCCCCCPLGMGRNLGYNSKGELLFFPSPLAYSKRTPVEKQDGNFRSFLFQAESRNGRIMEQIRYFFSGERTGEEARPGNATNLLLCPLFREEKDIERRRTPPLQKGEELAQYLQSLFLPPIPPTPWHN